MTKFVVGLTGLGSSMFSGFRKPIELPFKELSIRATTTGHNVFIQRVWDKWEEAYMEVVRAYKPGDKVVILAHSWGASAATLLAARLAAKGIFIDLFISEDQGLDSIWLKGLEKAFVVRDVPVGANVKELWEIHVVYERLTIAKSFMGKHVYEDAGSLPGGHTTTFTSDAFVDRVVARINAV